jgi:hypothetical protein
MRAAIFAWLCVSADGLSSCLMKQVDFGDGFTEDDICP